MTSKFDGDDRVKVVELTRGDRFYFSRKYELDDEMRAVLSEDGGFVQEINDFSKGPSTVKRLDLLQKLGLWGTAALEGSPVDQDDAVRILSGKNTDIDELNKLELLNIREAYAELDSLSDSPTALWLNEDIIKSKHMILTSGLKMKRNEPGRYRNLDHYPEVEAFEVGAKETGGVYRPPKLHQDVELLMKEFCSWINSDELLNEPPLIRGALAHLHLGMIHPFWDGNGRLCRLIEAMILASAGVRYSPRYMLKFYYDEYKEYYSAFRTCEKDKDKDVTAFIERVMVAHLSAQNEIFDEMYKCRERELAELWVGHLRECKAINDRQAKLILLLLERKDSVSIKIAKREFPYSMIYEKVSEDTVRRDLNKLQLLGVIDKSGQFYTVKSEFWKSPSIIKAIVG